MPDAGTITAFDTTSGLLTVTLANGTVVSATVNASTRIKCESEGDHERGHRGGSSARHEGGTSGSGKSSGNSGSGSKGDDDQGEDVGDDDPSSSGTSTTSDDDATKQDDDQGDDHGEDRGKGEDHGSACTVADLAVGTAVHEAQVSVTSAGTVFHEIELVRAAPATPAPTTTPAA